MNRIKTAILLLLAAFMASEAISSAFLAFGEGFPLGFLAAVCSAVAAGVLLLAALWWRSNSVRTLVRIYAMSLGALAIAGGLGGLIVGAFNLGGAAFAETLMPLAVLAAIIAAGALLFFGALAWQAPYARISRLVGWAILLVSNIPLISFSFVFLPLVVGAVPALMSLRNNNDR